MNKRKKTIHDIDFSLVIPCFNESLIFTESYLHIKRVLDGSRLSYELIFVDDTSSDDTPLQIIDVVARDRTCHAIFHRKNTGRGGAVMDGIREARGTIVGYIDIDCEVSPAYIPDIVHTMEEEKCDMVVGERRYRTEWGSLLRVILSRGYKMMIRLFLDTGGVDTESGYKFFRRKSILPILKFCRDTQWFWDTEIVVLSRNAGLRIVQYPVLFIRRFDKESSVHVIPDILGYLRSIWKYKMTDRSLARHV